MAARKITKTVGTISAYKIGIGWDQQNLGWDGVKRNVIRNSKHSTKQTYNWVTSCEYIQIKIINTLSLRS